MTLTAPHGRGLRRATAALLASALSAAALTTAAAPVHAAAAPQAARLATTQVVASSVKPADASVAWRECVAIRSRLLPAARSGRVYDVELETDVEVTGEDLVHTCRVRFLGRPAPTALARGVAQAAAAHPGWTLRTAPDTVHGVVYVARLRKISTHAQLGSSQRVADGVARWSRSCAGGGVDRTLVLRVASSTPISSAAMLRGQAAFARVAGVPVDKVVRRSPWTAPESLACVGHIGEFTHYSS